MKEKSYGYENFTTHTELRAKYKKKSEFYGRVSPIFEKYFNNFRKIFWKCSQNYFFDFLAFLYSARNSVRVEKIS